MFLIDLTKPSYKQVEFNLESDMLRLMNHPMSEQKDLKSHALIMFFFNFQGCLY